MAARYVEENMSETEISNEKPVITVNDLKFKYPVMERQALENINFTVNRGEFIGIIGPSGAGKTTLCMIMKGLIPHSIAGEISGEVSISSIQRRLKIGYNRAARIMELMEEDGLVGPPKGAGKPRDFLRHRK